MSRLEAQDEKLRAELSLGRRRTKGSNNAARARRAANECNPPGNAARMKPYIFGQGDT